MTTEESAPTEIFRVHAAARSALISFIEHALESSGCSIIQRSDPGFAPFRLSFLTPWGERIGIVAYAFLANTRPTKNRPADEHRFQVKYGSKDGRLHELWQDPYGLYTTLFLGINPDQGFFVAADPTLNSPTRFFISKEFKQSQVDEILSRGWHTWERAQRRISSPDAEPVEVLVGATAQNFLRYVLFEREALAEDQGYRQLIAEEFLSNPVPRSLDEAISPRAILNASQSPTIARLHHLEREFELSASELMELIAQAPRLRMAVRGWVAEKHLERALLELPAVRSVEPLRGDGQPDLRVEMKGGKRPVMVECKNVLRDTNRFGHARLDFQRTRASKADPCSRYYSRNDFDVVAACLQATTERWEFAGRRTSDMAQHSRCPDKLDHRVVIDELWRRDLERILQEAAA